MSLHVVYYLMKEKYGEFIPFKLWGVSFVPWVYMFLVGVFFQKNFNFFHRYLSGKAFMLCVIYLIVSYNAVKHFDASTGNGLNPLLYIILCMTVFSFAYTKGKLSGKLLKGNDISYGVYIYHAPIINILIYLGLVSAPAYVLLGVTATILAAMLSWFLIEKRCIKLKRDPTASLGWGRGSIVNGR